MGARSRKSQGRKEGGKTFGGGRAKPDEAAARPESRTLLWTAGLLLLGLFTVYSLNPNYLVVTDTMANVHQPLNMLHGNMTFTADSHPFMFKWKPANNDNRRIDINAWTPEVRKQYEAGAIKLVGPEYYLVESRMPGRYVNFFGIGAALTALPVYAVLEQFVPVLADHQKLMYFTCRELGAALVAFSALFVFLTAVALTERRYALIIALAYGMGTCVWSTCSQGLWQQSPNVFFLAMGMCLFVRIERSWWLAAPCAAAWAMAVWCRPTSAIVVVCAAVWLALRDRRALAVYLLAGLPFAALMVLYNHHYLGSPFAFGQVEGARTLAAQKTGVAEVWQTPLLQGLLGLLLSPARGLFVFSPFLLLAIPGMVRVWKIEKLAAMRPLLVAVLLILCVEARHFDWWGGWSYGYRHVLDLTVFMSLLLIPAFETVWHRNGFRGIFAAALLWSVVAQIIGVAVYDVTGWDNRKAVAVTMKDRPRPVIVLEESDARAMGKDPAFVKASGVKLNVDKPDFHRRLWSIKDSPLVYYVTHFSESRKQRTACCQRFLPELFGGGAAPAP